ncbi:MAG TPA: D-alanine--D-alanine ligase [Verrucomicrobiae bacterium]|nr:D-alanine--D-alanine ligase [Verrucomicrobiae bacterium]
MLGNHKLTIGLIFGGTSHEREVSLSTGKTVAKNLNKAKYEVLPIEISQSGKWLTESETIKQISSGSIAKNELVVFSPQKHKIDLAFLALHGKGGEDGVIQGMLESMNIKYTGSGVSASAIAMDKAKNKILVSSKGVTVCRHRLVNKDNFNNLNNENLDNQKVVVKPNKQGSSFGVSIISGKENILNAIKDALLYDDEVMVEDFIEGREFTVPVLGNEKPSALPVIEIRPKKSHFFDYKSKYEDGGAEEIVPAKISEDLRKDLQKISLQVHSILGCKGVTRSDFIVDKLNNIYFLEINTIPGMTPTSLVPKSALAFGMSFQELLDKIIELSLE